MEGHEQHSNCIRELYRVAEQQPFADVALATNPEPRCPCVLLLDVSGSMAEVVDNAGEDTGRTVEQDGRTYRVLSGGTTRIDLLNEGIRAYQADLMGDALAAQRVEVSVITFGARVDTPVPFVTAHEFVPPTLAAGGETPMGAAILQAERPALLPPLDLPHHGRRPHRLLAGGGGEGPGGRKGQGVRVLRGRRGGGQLRRPAADLRPRTADTQGVQFPGNVRLALAVPAERVALESRPGGPGKTGVARRLGQPVRWPHALGHPEL